MTDITVFTEAIKSLKIPYDKTFYNLSFRHYMMVAENIGTPKLIRHLKTILLYYKSNIELSEKVRSILRRVDSMLVENANKSETTCECGFLFLDQEYEKCPVCEKQIYKGNKCYYKEHDNEDFCTLDGNVCSWNKKTECGKFDGS